MVLMIYKTAYDLSVALLGKGSKHKKPLGFTIVELLIVTVVIGILASVTVVAYNGVQKMAYEARVASTGRSYLRALVAYDAAGGALLNQNIPYTCLGSVSDYPAGDGWQAGQCTRCMEPYECGDYVDETLDIAGGLDSITSGLSAKDIHTVLDETETELYYRGYTITNALNGTKPFLRVEWFLEGGDGDCGSGQNVYTELFDNGNATRCDIYHFY